MSLLESLYPELQLEAWALLPVLGPAFLVRHKATAAGYTLLVTDGGRGWAEKRDADYVTEKTKEWASCVDAEVEQMAQLVLQDLVAAPSAAGNNSTTNNRINDSISNSRSSSSVAICWSSSKDSLTMKLSTSLEGGLPYSWSFVLEALPHDGVAELVTVPLAVQLLAVTAALRCSEQQVRQLQQKLADLTPDGGKQQKEMTVAAQHKQSEREGQLRTAAGRVLQLGAAAAVVQLLPADVYAAVKDHREGSDSSGSSGAGSKVVRPPPRPRKALAPAVRPRPPASDLKAELLPESEQQARREAIQAASKGGGLNQQPDGLMLPASQRPNTDPLLASAAGPAVKKKKKRLNI